MGKPGQRIGDIIVIIDGKQKKHKKRLETIITLLGWSYILTAFAQIFFTLLMWAINIFFMANRLIMHNDMSKTIRVTAITFIISVISFVVLILWSEYNYRRFGKLRRRQFSNPVSNNELAAFFNISEEKINDMQQSKWIELDKTIV